MMIYVVTSDQFEDEPCILGAFRTKQAAIDFLINERNAKPLGDDCDMFESFNALERTRYEIFDIDMKLE